MVGIRAPAVTYLVSREQAAAMGTGHRNETAHQLANVLVNVDTELRTELLRELHEIMRSLDRFFGGIVADTSDQFDRGDVNYDSIRSGSGSRSVT